MNTHLVRALWLSFESFFLLFLKMSFRVLGFAVKFRLPLLLYCLIGCEFSLNHAILVFWLRLFDRLIVCGWDGARAWLDVVDGELLAVCCRLHVLCVWAHKRALNGLMLLHWGERRYGLWIDVQTIFQKMRRIFGLAHTWPTCLFFISIMLLAWTHKLV